MICLLILQIVIFETPDRGAPEIASTLLQQLGDDYAFLEVALDPSRLLTGYRELARLGFRAVPTQPSGIVDLWPQNVFGVRWGGMVISNAAARAGRVIVVHDTPVLEVDRADGPAALITLYGVPGQTYRMLTRTNLNEAPWIPDVQVQSSNRVLRLHYPCDTPLRMFRAVEE